MKNKLGLITNHLVMVFFLFVTTFCHKRPISIPLFNGKDLQGWEGNAEYFRVEDGAIIAGRLDDNIPQNEFLCTTKTYEDFDLRLKIKLVGEGDNGGVQFRSQRIPDDHEVSGYQADIGYIPTAWVKNFEEFQQQTHTLSDDEPYPLWGSLYDESRRAKILALADKEIVMATLKPEDWNVIRIRAEGQQIKIWVNDEPTIEYTEEENIAQSGIIGLQVHAGPPLEVWYKDIYIQEL